MFVDVVVFIRSVGQAMRLHSRALVENISGRHKAATDSGRVMLPNLIMSGRPHFFSLDEYANWVNTLRRGESRACGPDKLRDSPQLAV